MGPTPLLRAARRKCSWARPRSRSAPLERVCVRVCVCVCVCVCMYMYIACAMNCLYWHRNKSKETSTDTMMWCTMSPYHSSMYPALKVCAIGTAQQSFFRRDDCDGCMCAAGSVWINYRDPIYFGKGSGQGAEGASYCVMEKDWQQCYSSWPLGKYKPNFCWEFLWNGGRQTAGSDVETPKVVVDSCSLHGGCHVLIRRFRRWQVVVCARVAVSLPSTDEDVGTR